MANQGGIRVLPSGRFNIRWRDVTGRTRSATFERRADAEFELRRRTLEVEEQRRGLRRLTVEDRTFGQLCDLWLETRAKAKRSAEKDAQFIRVHLRPALGERRLRFLRSLSYLDRLPRFLLIVDMGAPTGAARRPPPGR